MKTTKKSVQVVPVHIPAAKTKASLQQVAKGLEDGFNQLNKAGYSVDLLMIPNHGYILLGKQPQPMANPFASMIPMSLRREPQTEEDEEEEKPSGPKGRHSLALFRAALTSVDMRDTEEDQARLMKVVVEKLMSGVDLKDLNDTIDDCNELIEAHSRHETDEKDCQVASVMRRLLTQLEVRKANLELGRGPSPATSRPSTGS